MKHSHAEKPRWAYSQRQADITDVWVEEGNDEGPAITAHMSTDPRDVDQFVTLDGIEVEDIGVTLFYDRIEAIQYLGIDAVDRIEAAEHELLWDEVRFA